jgi:hypothetical protein
MALGKGNRYRHGVLKWDTVQQPIEKEKGWCGSQQGAGMDSGTSGRRGALWCIRPPATGTERVKRSPVLTDRE